MRTETPGFGKASGAAWPCLLSLMVDLFICGLSDMINCINCICYVLHEFSCWASAHGCSVLQVRAKTESTSHEYGEREAMRTCLACPTALVGGLFEKWL